MVEFPCPTCGVSTPVPRGDGTEKGEFPQNIFLQKVQAAAARKKAVDSHCGNYPDSCQDGGTENVQYCIECGAHYCPECRAKHDSMKPLKGHRFISAADATGFITEESLKEALVCEIHRGEELKFYCEEDGCVVCRDCSVTKHKPHTVLDIKGAIIENTKGKISTLVSEGIKLAYQSEHSGKDCQHQLEMCEEKIRRQKDEIQTEADNLKAMIDVECQQLCNKVDQHFGSRMEQIRKDKELFEKNQTKINDVIEFTEKLLKYGSEPVIMTHAKALKKKLRELTLLKTSGAPERAEIDVTFVPKQPTSHDIANLLGVLHDGRKEGSESSLPESLRVQEPSGSSSSTLTEPIDIPTPKVPLPSPGTPNSPWQTPNRESPDEDRVSLYSRRETPDVTAPPGGLGVTCTFNARMPKEKSCRLYGCAIDENGDIYITDEGNKKMKLFAHTGHLKSEMKLTANWPAGIAILKKGHVVISDNSKANFYDNLFKNPRGKVDIFMPKTELLIKSIGEDKVKKPWGVATNSRGEILVCDVHSKCLFIFEPGGSYKTVISLAQCSYPMDIAVSPTNDTVFVSDSHGHQIIGLGVHGEPLMRYGSKSQQAGSGIGELKFPRGICVDHRGHVFIADSENGRVVQLHPDCSFFKEVDIPGLEQPVAVAVNSKGQLAVVEYKGIVHVVQYLKNDSE
ncbi:E3 ubiquitin-protein ligase TRIM71-like [Lingula anatina]|uniref:E3 ubiquitin-protein ligase TRIM71-like n=1 Tax=Lingula anatina TaxID=7574 RepID=A0A2R2MN96_LINAN|nr:E3 ubiquitin-protein ligase TRIM71-like [Lingula anatina]|eukprot:XP_023931681.1 E3 ubiquitin-protein ligase TRIM71-like [Lingula anatina]